MSIDIGGPSTLWAAPFPGKVLLGCIRSWLSMDLGCIGVFHSFCFKCPLRFSLMMNCDPEAEINPSFPEVALGQCFIAATERKLDR